MNSRKQMKFESILVVTYARSGSTLLQGVLNSIDGVLIRGENKNFIQGLYDAYLRLHHTYKFGNRNNVDSLSQRQSFQPIHPWYGADVINMQIFLKHCKSMVQDILLAEYKEDKNIVCYGFKEIRYFELLKSGIELNKYLDFLQQIFPNVAIVFNTRNLDNVTNSIIWSDRDKILSIAALMKLENDFKSYKNNNLKNTFSISYEDIISKSENLKSLFNFLGCEYSEKAIDDVLSIPHSFNHKSINIVDGKVTSEKLVK